MKINSVLGKMTGKIGNVVIMSSGGKVIGREYNPNVTNPNTSAQKGVRARFKMASQLSASLGPVIAIRKEGNVSARNLFTKVNFPAILFSENIASVNLNQVQLTKSNRGFAGFNADRSSGSSIALELNADCAAALTRVVYVAYKKGSDGTLTFHDSKICESAGADGKFADVLRYTADAVVCYAYGMKDLDGAITNKFGEMNAPTAQDAAQLLVSSTENMSQVALTKTAGLTMAVGESTGDSDDVEHFTVNVVTSGNGRAIGGGRFDAGQTVTLTATPDAEASFVAWKRGSASGEILSTNATYSFEATQNVTICAVFQGGPTPHYEISASVDPAAGGTITGTGSKEEGSSCTLACILNEGYRFVGWYENNELVSNQRSYTFTVANARTLVARVAEQAAVFSSMKVNNVDWSENKSQNTGTKTITGAASADMAGKTVALVNSASKPEAGQSLEALTSAVLADSGEISLSHNEQHDATLWCVIGTPNESNVAVEEVYDYYIQVVSGEN